MKINGTFKQQVSIEIEPIEMIKSLFSYYFNGFEMSHVIKKDNKLYFENDVSMHGSPIYEYVEITDDSKKIKIYEALKNLLENI